MIELPRRFNHRVEEMLLDAIRKGEKERAAEDERRKGLPDANSR